MQMLSKQQVLVLRKHKQAQPALGGPRHVAHGNRRKLRQGAQRGSASAV